MLKLVFLFCECWWGNFKILNKNPSFCLNFLFDGAVIDYIPFSRYLQMRNNTIDFAIYLQQKIPFFCCKLLKFLLKQFILQHLQLREFCWKKTPFSVIQKQQKYHFAMLKILFLIFVYYVCIYFAKVYISILGLLTCGVETSLMVFERSDVYAKIFQKMYLITLTLEVQVNLCFQHDD